MATLAGGFPAKAPRIRLKDGRRLAYSETGVPKDEAKFKIILAHGFMGSRLDLLRASTVTFLSFDFQARIYIQFYSYKAIKANELCVAGNNRRDENIYGLL